MIYNVFYEFLSFGEKNPQARTINIMRLYERVDEYWLIVLLTYRNNREEYRPVRAFRAFTY